MPRIIAGEAGGIRLETLNGRLTRPTADRAKEALFSMLDHVFKGKPVLDLFSGSGSLGLEALSRGAQDAVFAENNGQCAAIIKKNIERCGFSERARIIKADASKAISLLAEEGHKFGCIFMDPPYDKGLVMTSIENIISGDIIEKEGILVVEHSEKEKPVSEIIGLTKLKSRSYGAINFSLYVFRSE